MVLNDYLSTIPAFQIWKPDYPLFNIQHKVPLNPCKIFIGHWQVELGVGKSRYLGPIKASRGPNSKMQSAQEHS